MEQSLFGTVRHSFGFNQEESARIAKSNAAIAARVTFWFNSDEPERVEKGKRYDRPTRLGHYPLAAWGWNRQRCLDYILEMTGAKWRKSACPYCPFARLTEDLIARQAEFSEAVADPMVLERLSLAMNPRGQLYKDQPLYQIVSESGNQTAIKLFEARMQSHAWAVYRIRRIYHAKPIYGDDARKKRVITHDHTKKGRIQRCVERLLEFPSSEAACQRLNELARAHGVHPHRLHDISYVSLKKSALRYPTVEEYLVAAPALVETKARYGVEKFD